MDMVLLWVVGMIAIVLLCLLACYIALKRYIASKRLVKPFSGRMAAEKGLLDKGLGKKGAAWHERYLWLIVLVIGTVIVCIECEVPVAEIGMWSWSHWLPILTIWGIAFLLITLYPDVFGVRVKTLQRALIIVIVVLFVEIPIGGRIMTPSFGTPQRTVQTATSRQALPQDTPNLPRAWNADGTLTDVTKWPQVQVLPHGDSVRVPNIFGGHLVWGGSGFKVHCVYEDGHEGIVGDAHNPCSDGSIVSMYAHNEGGGLLYASYAYATMHEK